VSQENVELVRSIYADWERGDFGRIDWADPEIEFERPDGVMTGRWQGLAGMARGWGEFVSSWEDLRATADDLRQLDDGRVLVLTTTAGRNKTTGLQFTNPAGATLFTIGDGKITRLVTYWDRARALADLGLEE
jgi:ketosteroid isomerase-like protein